MLGVVIILIPLVMLIWMSINNYLDGKGRPKIHIHRYVPHFRYRCIEVCKTRKCDQWRLR